MFILLERGKRNMKFKGDIIVTDPCYICKDDDWSKSNYGDDMNKLGITNYICRDTIYGDWSCTTFNTDTNEAIGEFCADAGMVGVFLLDEVLKYNPDFNYHIEIPWTTTLIKNFDGDVNFEINEYDEVEVIGRGNINFIGIQTSL